MFLYHRLFHFVTVLLPVLFLVSFNIGEAKVVEVTPYADELPFNKTWVNEGDTLEQATEVHNINVWKVEDYELPTMYEDPYVLRRTDNTLEAWVIFELPYIDSLEILGYFWPEHENEFSVFLSSDGETWEETTPIITRIPDTEGKERWTKKKYQLFNLDKITHMKIVWPEVDASSNDWWNPYLGSIIATISQPRPDAIISYFPEEMQIPRFDTDSVTLSGAVVDQLGIAMENYPVSWTAEQPLPAGLLLSPEGMLTIDSSCNDGATLRVTGTAIVPEFKQQLVSVDQIDMQGITAWKWVPTGNMVTLETQKEIVFHAALLGDTDGNLQLDQVDLDFVCQHYGAQSTDKDWNSIRLADIDENQRIDIVDVAYFAKYSILKQENEASNEEATEVSQDKTEEKAEPEGDSIKA